MAQIEELPKRRKSKVKWVILILLILLLGGGAAAFWMFDLKSKFFEGDSGGAGATATQAVDANGQPLGPNGQPLIPAVINNTYVAHLDPFVVNLKDQLGRSYLSLTFDAEVVSPVVIKELEALNFKVRDSIIMLLANKTEGQLMSSDGSITLKNEIVDRLNQIVGAGKITNIYIQNIKFY